MKDYQLAIAICRVYEGDHSPLLKEILENNIIPMAIEKNDRWLASIVFALLNKQKDAARAIVVPLSQFTNKDVDTSEGDSAETVHDPNAFILFHYLKKKLRQENIVPYHIEYGFLLLVSRSYERLGCPLLALHILSRYYMKPPSAIKAAATPKEDEKEIKLEKAEDLFGSEPASKPSYATDLFADDEPTPKRSRASDLFADDDNDLFATPKKPAYTDDLFADDNDLFVPKKASTSLFDDDDIFSSDKQIADKDEEEEMEEEEDIISMAEREDDGLDSYKALLVIRMLQTFFHAASALYNSLETPDNMHEVRFRSHFIRNRQALLELGESVKIPPHTFSRLLMEKSIETDVFPLYLYILNESVPKDFDVHQFLRAFKVGCFEVCEVAFMPQELDYATLVFVENWAG